MNPVKTQSVRTKTFTASERFLQDTEVASNSIVGSVLGVKSEPHSKSHAHAKLTNPYHSRELMGIPPALKLDPVSNEELRITQKLDDTSAYVYLQRESSVCPAVICVHYVVDI